MEQTAFHLNTRYSVWNFMTQWVLLTRQAMVKILPEEDRFWLVLVDVIMISSHIPVKI